MECGSSNLWITAIFLCLKRRGVNHLQLFKRSTTRHQQKMAAKMLMSKSNQPIYNPFTTQVVLGHVTEAHEFERNFTISKSITNVANFSAFKLQRSTTDLLSQLHSNITVQRTTNDVDEQRAAQAVLGLLIQVPTKYFK